MGSKAAYMTKECVWSMWMIIDTVSVWILTSIMWRILNWEVLLANLGLLFTVYCKNGEIKNNIQMLSHCPFYSDENIYLLSILLVLENDLFTNVTLMHFLILWDEKMRTNLNTNV